MRAGLYARVSTTEQAEEGYSIDEQILAIERFCEAKGWQVVDRYVDRGVSGSTADRPELRRLLADVRAQRLDVVICHAVDRFYRSLQGLLGALDQLRQANVTFVSLTENLDFTTPWGKLSLAVLGSMAEIYIDKLKVETAKGKLGRARKGLSNASTTPYGYRRTEDGRDVVDPETSSAVLLAFESYARGELSDMDVARLLNRKGHKPSGRAQSGRWTREGVRYLLTNAFYIGLVRHGDALFPGQHEPIISEELFDDVQAIRARRSRSRGGRRRSDRVYLLGGVAVCADCGLGLVAQTSSRPGRRDIAQYLCPAHRRSIPCAARPRLTRADVIDAQVGELCKRITLPDDWRERLEELAGDREARRERADRRRELEGKIKRLRQLYIEGDFDKAEYDWQRASLQAQLDDLQEPETGEVEAAGEVLANLADVWDGAPVTLQAQLLKTIFQEVRVDLARRRLVCVKPWGAFERLFRLDGLHEKEGYFYVKENEAGPEGGTVSETDSGGPAPGPGDAHPRSGCT
jgi:site-specific DNA recombinase